MDCQPEPVVMDTLQYLTDLAVPALNPPDKSPTKTTQAQRLTNEPVHLTIPRRTTLTSTMP